MHRAAVLFLLCGCTTYLAPPDATPNTGRSVVLHEDTVLLDQQVAELTVARDYLLVDSADAVSVGSVVVGQRDGGYLRRVLALHPDGDSFRLQTEPAGLRDALLEAHIHTQVPVTRRGVQRWDIDDVVLADRTVYGSAGYAHVSATLEDTWVTFEPMLTVDLELDEDDDEASVQLGFTLAAGTDLVVAADGSLSHSAEALLFADAIPFSFAIGPVPVVGTADLSVHAGYEVWAEGSGEVGMYAEGQVQAEVEAGWAWGDWYGDYGATSDFTVEPWSDVDGGAGAKVWLRGDVGATLYGSTSVYASVVPWMEGEVCDLDSYRVDAGVDGEMGFDLAVFGWDVWSSDPIELGSWSVDLAESDPGACL